jgi:hypothetical protein
MSLWGVFPIQTIAYRSDSIVVKWKQLLAVNQNTYELGNSGLISKILKSLVVE